MTPGHVHTAVVTSPPYPTGSVFELCACGASRWNHVLRPGDAPTPGLWTEAPSFSSLPAARQHAE